MELYGKLNLEVRYRQRGGMGRNNKIFNNSIQQLEVTLSKGFCVHLSVTANQEERLRSQTCFV